MLQRTNNIRKKSFFFDIPLRQIKVSILSFPDIFLIDNGLLADLKIVADFQTVSCEIKFAHAHVRARPHVCDVRAKRLSKRACDVRACGRFKVRDVRKQFRTFLGEKRA